MTKTRPDIMPILTDLPIDAPRLGFEKYVTAIAAAIRGGSPAQYTIGLYGPWGKGKSSILRGIEQELKNESGITTVNFDAWRYEKAPDLIVPLVWRMRKVIDEKRSALKVLATALRSLEVEFSGVTLRQGPQKSELTDDRFLSALDALSTLGESLDSKQRIVVLVDDLDRCSPGRVMDVIESIRILMDVPGFVFVLAIDYEVLKRAIQAQYENVDADQFIEKIVQVPFRIPELSGSEGSLVATIVPGWENLQRTWFVSIKTSDMDGIAKGALRGNPRQIKRVINSAMLARHINWSADSEDEVRLLLASLAMQQRWPDEFGEMIVAIERLVLDEGAAESETLGDVIADLAWASEDAVEDSHDLNAFLSSYLPPRSPLSAVIGTLRLASEASGTGPQEWEIKSSYRRRKSSKVIVENGLIAEGEPLALNLENCVRKEVRVRVSEWMNHDQRRSDFTWTGDSTRPLHWAYDPGERWTLSGLVARIFELSGGPEKVTFSAAVAWRYRGRSLTAVANDVPATRKAGDVFPTNLS